MSEKINNLIPDSIDKNKINKIIGTGSEGIVVSYDQDKILKITMRPRISPDKFLEICEFIYRSKPSHVMNVYEFGTFENNKYYWYLGEKLSPLKNYEKLEIKKNFYSYYRYTSKNIPFQYVKSKSKRLNEFWNFLSQFDYKYNDLWEENIMRTADKKLKIIDLEGFVTKCQ